MQLPVQNSMDEDALASDSEIATGLHCYTCIHGLWAFAKSLCNVYITISIFRKFDRPPRIGIYSLKSNDNTI